MTSRPFSQSEGKPLFATLHIVASSVDNLQFYLCFPSFLRPGLLLFLSPFQNKSPRVLLTPLGKFSHIEWKKLAKTGQARSGSQTAETEQRSTSQGAWLVLRPDDWAAFSLAEVIITDDGCPTNSSEMLESIPILNPSSFNEARILR